VAHDFNLLIVIRGSLDLLRRPGVSDEKRQRYIDAISGSADSATKLAGQLLALARWQSLKRKVSDAAVSWRWKAPMRLRNWRTGRRRIIGRDGARMSGVELGQEIARLYLPGAADHAGQWV